MSSHSNVGSSHARSQVRCGPKLVTAFVTCHGVCTHRESLGVKDGRHYIDHLMHAHARNERIPIFKRESAHEPVHPAGCHLLRLQAGV